MKCPLLKRQEAEDNIGYEEEFLDCVLGSCAWWNDLKNCCSIKVIAKELTWIQLKLPGEKKMVL